MSPQHEIQSPNLEAILLSSSKASTGQGCSLSCPSSHHVRPHPSYSRCSSGQQKRPSLVSARYHVRR